MVEMGGRPVVRGLMVMTDEGIRLRGSRCRSCDTLHFPHAPFCANPTCSKDRDNVEDQLLGPRGVLWSWTVQHVAAPAPFRHDHIEAPYAVGMVDLAEGIRVLGLMSRTSGLTHGMDVGLEQKVLYHDGPEPVVTWCWSPADES